MPVDIQICARRMRYDTNGGPQYARHNRKTSSSSPLGRMPAGYSVPVRLTVRQEQYCRRAIGITRFIYNLPKTTEISGATGSTYTLTDSEVGKTIKVRVSFSDDAGNAESLSGEPTSAVKHSLTATARNVPERHDGSGNIRFDLVFDHELGPDLSYVTLRDHAFTVTGGTLLRAKRVDPPGNVEWRITVRPTGSEDVVITLPVTTNCDAQGAVCMDDGRKLSNSVVATVPLTEAVSETNEVQPSDAD